MSKVANPTVFLSIVSIDSQKSHLLFVFLPSNTLTDPVLRVEVGIEKMGHRMRILSQLRQDALVLFQLEMLYRSAKNNA